MKRTIRFRSIPADRRMNPPHLHRATAPYRGNVLYCTQALRLISCLHTEELLSGTEAQRLREHLRRCASCRHIARD